MDIKTFKKEFDDIFLSELNELIKDVKENLVESSTQKYIDYILKLASHGKRIRPFNAALTYTMYSNKNWKEIQHVLLGIELIHLMALVHDDIMDNSEIRHGVLSMHAFIFETLPKNTASKETIKQLAHSEAILIGDLLFAWAYRMFSRTQLNQTSWKMIHILVQEVIGGQMLDVHNTIEAETTAEIIEQKMLLKTARYTFTRPLLLGATCAGQKLEDVAWLNSFGDSIGLLFQMKDDILDITGKAETIKKDPLSDIKNGVHTLLSNHVLTNGSTNQKERWNNWFGNKELSNQDEICTFLETVGTFEFAKEYTKTKKEIAIESLNQSGTSDDTKKYILLYLETITERTY